MWAFLTLEKKPLSVQVFHTTNMSNDQNSKTQLFLNVNVFTFCCLKKKNQTNPNKEKIPQQLPPEPNGIVPSPGSISHILPPPLFLLYGQKTLVLGHTAKVEALMFWEISWQINSIPLNRDQGICTKTTYHTVPGNTNGNTILVATCAFLKRMKISFSRS